MIGSPSGGETGSRALNIRSIAMDHPWSWLNAGWNDFTRRPAIGLIYGLTFTVVSYALAACLNYLDLLYLLLPLGAAFALAGPMLAFGLYKASRRMEANEPVWLRDILTTGARADTVCDYRPATADRVPGLAAHRKSVVRPVFQRRHPQPGGIAADPADDRERAHIPDGWHVCRRRDGLHRICDQRRIGSPSARP